MLLMRSVLAVYVLVPLAALALVTLLTLPPGVEIGLLVLAVSAGAPLLPRKLLSTGDGAHIFSLVVTTSLLAIVLVPAWLALLGPWFGYPVQLHPERVAWVFAKTFFVPLALGMLIRWRYPAFADRFGDRLMAIAGLLLTACALALLVLHWEVLLDVKWSGMLALAGLIVAALAIGHLLGGPTEDDRTALALAKATALQATIWTQAIAAGQREGASPDAIKLLLPALNEMFDIATTRTMATQTHPPYVIYSMLIALAVASACWPASVWPAASRAVGSTSSVSRL